jgi:pimeloyl-ACP methyl ester carboxylesterase
VRRTHRNFRRVGLSLLLSILATPVLAGTVALYRHPSLTMREALRLRLLLSGASERAVDVGGLRVRYFESIPESPRPDQETLVLVHGFGDSAETWSLVLPRLKHGWRIVAPDLAGFGRTPIPPEGMKFSVLTDYLSRFLDAMGVQRLPWPATPWAGR